ncbi:putative Serine/threonine-protein kinase SSK22 [Hypsibius exemplaris]|uniref:Serine/threonine-protein kinase SSK22 n=1 Tax=Hypsibius exemplaris TaxID=2072580 RepID=A0A9X6NKW3_HYPEX|nr:putative Serine/threonine-protein kinase SSK22 [Hypsibius exemplaris]
MADSKQKIIFVQSVEYRVSDPIGEGRFGQVFQAKAASPDLESGQTCPDLAVKLLNSVTAKGDNHFRQKMDRLILLQHPNLIRYFAIESIHGLDFSEEALKSLIIMDYCNGGSLHSWLKTTELSEEEVTQNADQLIQGIAYIHEQGIVHTDLKPQNIMRHCVSSSEVLLKICDMDDAILLESTNTLSTDIPGQRGSAAYFSPEMAGRYSPRSGSALSVIGRKTDIWSFGCVVLDMALAPSDEMEFVMPSRGAHVKADSKESMLVDKWTKSDDIIAYINAGGIRKVPESLTSFVKSLVFACFQINPSHRPSAERIRTAIQNKSSEEAPFGVFEMVRNEELQNKLAEKSDVKAEVLPDQDGLIHVWSNWSLRRYCMKDLFIDLKYKKMLYVQLSRQGINLHRLFKNVYDRVAVLHLKFDGKVKNSSWSSGILADAHLPHLLELSFTDIYGMVLEVGHFSGFPRLRALVFTRCRIRFMEDNFLRDIPDLQYVGLNIGWNNTETAFDTDNETQWHFRQIRFSKEYSWLREYFQANPHLTSPKRPGEVWCIGSARNPEWSENELIYPDHQWEFLEESLIRVPHFHMGNYSEEDVLLLLSTLHPEVLVELGRSHPWRVCWDEANNPADIEAVLRTIVTLGKGHPIHVEITGYQWSICPALLPAAEYISNLTFFQHDNFRSDILKDLVLPNLTPNLLHTAMSIFGLSQQLKADGVLFTIQIVVDPILFPIALRGLRDAVGALVDEKLRSLKKGRLCAI